MPLNELSSSPRTAGFNSVMRSLKRGEVIKIFLADDAAEKLAGEVRRASLETQTPVEIAEDSVKLGRACVVSHKTAVAAILKK